MYDLVQTTPRTASVSDGAFQHPLSSGRDDSGYQCLLLVHGTAATSTARPSSMLWPSDCWPSAAAFCASTHVGTT